MNTGTMLGNFTREDIGKCVSGTFAGDFGVLRSDGVLLLVNNGELFDFWDPRFSNCEWEVVKNPSSVEINLNGTELVAQSIRYEVGEDEEGAFDDVIVTFGDGDEERFDSSDVVVIDVTA